jgi:hypothetical protein
MIKILDHREIFHYHMSMRNYTWRRPFTKFTGLLFCLSFKTRRWLLWDHRSCNKREITVCYNERLRDLMYRSMATLF